MSNSKAKLTIKKIKILIYELQSIAKYSRSQELQNCYDRICEFEEYYKLKNSTDSTDKVLFKILEILKDQHVKAQFEDGRFLNTYKLYYYIPQKNREKFEDLSKTVSIVKKRFTQQVQEEGGSNFNNDQRDETVGEMSKELNDKGLVGSFFSGISNRFKQFFSAKKDLQIDPYASQTYKTSFGSDPSETTVCTVWGKPIDGSSTLTCYVRVEIEYTVLLAELKEVTQS